MAKKKQGSRKSEITRKLVEAGRISGNDPHKNVGRSPVYELKDLRSQRKHGDKGVYHGK